MYIKKPKRVIVINTELKQVYEAHVCGLKDMQKIVGGLIERAMILDNGDEIYVNEEGLFDQSLKPFVIDGNVFIGNAYIIGSVTSSGGNRPAASSVDDIYRQITFLESAGSI